MYCCQCHRECGEHETDTGPKGQPLSDCHGAQTLMGRDQWIVMAIRRLWAADCAIMSDGTVDREQFNPDYPFGNASWSDGSDQQDPVQADLELLDAFNAERQYQDDDLHTMWVLIRG